MSTRAEVGRAQALLNVRHGHGSPKHRSPTYNTWATMWQRCANPKAPNYDRYGGRGITIDPRWKSFENFLADMGIRPKGTTIDRIDNDGPYTKDNCRWSASEIQNANKRTIKYSIADVERMCEMRRNGDTLQEIAAVFGTGFRYISRLTNGRIGALRQRAVLERGDEAAMENPK